VQRRPQHRRLATTSTSTGVCIRGGGGVTSTKKLAASSRRSNGGKSPPWIEGLKNSLASALAAACSKIMLAPLDTLKTVQQQYHVSTGAPQKAAALTLKQAMDLVVSRPGGFFELYAGVGVAVVGSMPSVGLYFGVYSYCKRLIQPRLVPDDPNNKYRGLLMMLTITTSAAIGNTIASFSRVPYEVMKQKLQTGMYTNTWQAMMELAKHDGIRGFFPMGGIGIQMLRDIPYAMTTLLCYELLKVQFQPWKERFKESTSLVDAFTGAVAGGVGSYVTNPMDVIKTRLQTESQLYGGSIMKCFHDTWMEGGPSAFLRGSVPRLLHKVPANGIFFLFYELFRTLLRVEEEQQVEDYQKQQQQKKKKKR